jgi:DNA polymerase eta
MPPPAAAGGDIAGMQLQQSRWRKQANRVIIHCDLDCFYVQVERKLDPSLHGRPVVVCQYTGGNPVIALSYEAKAIGVKRNMTAVEARRVCPQVAVCVVPSLNEKVRLRLPSGWGDECHTDVVAHLLRVCRTDPVLQAPPKSFTRVGHCQADLTRYREAGSEVFEICHSFGSGCERTSIDEAYLDISTTAVRTASCF